MPNGHLDPPLPSNTLSNEQYDIKTYAIHTAYSNRRELYNNVVHFVHINFCIALLCGLVFFLTIAPVGMTQSEVCKYSMHTMSQWIICMCNSIFFIIYILYLRLQTRRSVTNLEDMQLFVTLVSYLCISSSLLKQAQSSVLVEVL